jgi:hypothetical protein
MIDSIQFGAGCLLAQPGDSRRLTCSLLESLTGSRHKTCGPSLRRR